MSLRGLERRFCARRCSSCGGGTCGVCRMLWFVTKGREMSSDMGGSQHSAISFRREWIASSVKRYRLLLSFSLVCCL
jgi:hypothetical protein